MRMTAIGAACAALLAVGTPAVAGSYTYTILPGPTGAYPVATAINDSDVVVGSVTVSGTSEGYIWANGSYTLVPAVSGFTSVNNAGIALGAPAGQNPTNMYVLYNIATAQMQTFTVNTTDVDGILLGIVDNAGNVFGDTSGMKKSNYGFVVQGGSTQFIQNPGAKKDNTSPKGIDGAGGIVGTYYAGKYNTASHIFSDLNGAFTTIDPPGITNPYVAFVSSNGVIGGAYTVKKQKDLVTAFIGDGATWTTIAYPGAFATSVSGVSSTGVIAGSEYTNRKHYVEMGWIQINGIFHVINPGLPNSAVNGINANNSLIGSTLTQQNLSYSFVAQCPQNQRPCTQ
jgi:hypothetical protein